MLLVFKKSDKWTGGLGNPDYKVVADVPIEVCEYTAKLALDSGSAHEYVQKNEGNPAKIDKYKAEKVPFKRDKKKANKK